METNINYGVSFTKDELSTFIKQLQSLQTEDANETALVFTAEDEDNSNKDNVTVVFQMKTND